jgi:hypothetical protein
LQPHHRVYHKARYEGSKFGYISVENETETLYGTVEVFRSDAFDIDALYRKLTTVFVKVLPPKTIDGRGLF